MARSDGSPASTRERGDRVDVQDADPGTLTLASDDRQDGQLGHRERGGDLGRDDAAHGLAAATLERGLAIWRAGASWRAREGQGLALMAMRSVWSRRRLCGPVGPR